MSKDEKINARPDILIMSGNYWVSVIRGCFDDF